MLYVPGRSYPFPFLVDSNIGPERFPVFCCHDLEVGYAKLGSSSFMVVKRAKFNPCLPFLPALQGRSLLDPPFRTLGRHFKISLVYFTLDPIVPFVTPRFVGCQTQTSTKGKWSANQYTNRLFRFSGPTLWGLSLLRSGLPCWCLCPGLCLNGIIQKSGRYWSRDRRLKG